MYTELDRNRGVDLELMKKDLRTTYIEWLERGLEGLIPIYDKDGRNATLVILANNSPIEDFRRLDTVLKGLAQLYQKDLDLIKKKAMDITGQRTMNPLPLSPIGILVPFRMRKPIGRNDGAIGYFFNHAIEEIGEKDGSTQVVLKDGRIFCVMDSITAARHRIQCACQVKDHFNSYGIGIEKPYRYCMEWEQFYNQPATRGDIAMLLSDLKALAYITSKIKESIES